MSSQKITVKKTAVYHTFGHPETATKIIFALHGYGQLAQYFIRKFQNLSDDYFVIAPEGLHRFYLSGSSGRVGASWMTKEKRLNDINDNIDYLNQLWLQFKSKHLFDKHILLGFSQGGATASRWHQLGNFNADQFILWASVFPPDLNQEWTHIFNQSDNHFVVGSKDEYYNTKKITDQEDYFKQNHVKFRTRIYDGKHSIDPTLLNDILK